MLKNAFFFIFFNFELLFRNTYKKGIKNGTLLWGGLLKWESFPSVCLMYGSVMKRLLFALFFGAVGYGNR